MNRYPAMRSASRWLLWVPIAVMLHLALGCASGSFSTSSDPSGGSGSGSQTQPPNPPSLPPLASATATNDYVGSQIPGPYSAVPENITTLHIDQSAKTYKYATVATSDAPTNPVPDSSGLLTSWYGFWDMGDTSGATGVYAPAQFGLALEVPSRFSFFVSSPSQQIAALVPRQSSGCIIPSAAARYSFVTLFGANFVTQTDTGYGTFQLSMSGSSYHFDDEKQFTLASGAATTGLVALDQGACRQSTGSAGQGSYIDTPATAANAQTEIQSFLGPTGILVANQQAVDQFGNPLPLAGLLGMIQPSSPVDVTQVESSSVVFRALQYQPFGQNIGAALYGYAEHQSDDVYLASFGDPFSAAATAHSDLLQAAFFNPQAPSTSPESPSIALALGPQDAKNPGLFPNAQFVYGPPSGTTACPDGTKLFFTASAGNINCSSPAVAVVGQHAGKYVLFVSGDTGAFVYPNSGPTIIILVQQ